MDSGVAPRHSHPLVEILTSTYPPPFGERNRQSMRTTSHIDSHMMGDHEEGIPEPPSPSPSPDLTELGPVISKIGTF